jgi:hypothetical protein
MDGVDLRGQVEELYANSRLSRYGQEMLHFAEAYGPFMHGADIKKEQQHEFYDLYKMFIDFQEEFLEPFLESEGQTYEDFGEYASVAVEGAASATTRRVLQNFLQSMDYESFLKLMEEFHNLVDEDGLYVVA